MAEPEEEEIRFALLGDEPVATLEHDLLGTSRAAHQLAELLLSSRKSTPYTLAVDAGWGAGKSSLMRLVDAELRQTPGVHSVWYNAWTSTGADALEGLIKSVLAQFDRRVLRRALNRITERRAVLGALRAGLLLGAGPLGVAGLVDALWRTLSVDAAARNTMQGALRDLTEEWAANAYQPGKMLVVFIDDLDRCSEETVLAVCEAVKIYLDVPGLAFVIGCDRAALEPQGLLSDLSPAGSAFMEKIFQTSYRLPKLSVVEVEAYVARCAEWCGIDQLLNHQLTMMIAERSDRNPRRVKRLLNGFVLEARLYPLWQDFGPESAIRILLLHYLYPDFYRALINGGGSANAVYEFLHYRQARQIVLGLQRAEEIDSWDAFTQYFVEHEVAAPDPDRTDTWAAALIAVERHIIPELPALVRDSGFVSLIEGLIALPEMGQLISRLQEGTVQPVTAGPGATLNRPYEGMRILWIDDNMRGNRSFVEMLRGKGVEVFLADNRAEAERIFASAPITLLLSDLGRGGDPVAGLSDLKHWRESGQYTGPVIFFTPYMTAPMVQQAQQLNAMTATSIAQLVSRLDDMAPVDPSLMGLQNERHTSG